MDYVGCGDFCCLVEVLEGGLVWVVGRGVYLLWFLMCEVSWRMVCVMVGGRVLFVFVLVRMVEVVVSCFCIRLWMKFFVLYLCS